MKIYDITHRISKQLPTYDDGEPIIIERTEQIKNGDIANCSKIVMSSHSGTHIDAPLHFIDGATSIDNIEFDRLIGQVKVIDLSEYDEISAEILKAEDLTGFERIIIKTKSGKYMNEQKFYADFTSLSYEATQYLMTMQVKTIGIDYLSIESFHTKDYEVHKLLLANDVVIIEGLNLDDVAAGVYDLVALPLKIENCDGAPARVILIEK